MESWCCTGRRFINVFTSSKIYGSFSRYMLPFVFNYQKKNEIYLLGMCDGGLEDGCLAASRDDTTINALDVVSKCITFATLII